VNVYLGALLTQILSVILGGVCYGEMLQVAACGVVTRSIRYGKLQRTLSIGPACIRPPPTPAEVLAQHIATAKF
jgi:hypothetical protein